MRTHVFLALSRPAAGRDVEFHRWYDASHLRDVVDLCPGFVAGQRFFAEPGMASPEWPSLAVYQLSSDDLDALHRDVSANASRFTPSNGVFAPDHAAWVYSARDGEDSALANWLAKSDRSCLSLVFLSSADLPGAMLAGFDPSPILQRGNGQRSGENPAWPYLLLLRGGDAATAEDSLRAVAGPIQTWSFKARGDRVFSRPRD